MIVLTAEFLRGSVIAVAPQSSSTIGVSDGECIDASRDGCDGGRDCLDGDRETSSSYSSSGAGLLDLAFASVAFLVASIVGILMTFNATL